MKDKRGAWGAAARARAAPGREQGVLGRTEHPPWGTPEPEGSTSITNNVLREILRDFP